MSRTRILAIALFASFTLNLFLGGLLAGRHGPLGWHHWGKEKETWHDKSRAERMEHWLSRGLSEEARPIVRRLVAENAEKLEADRASHRENRERVRAALMADPFDAAAYEAALDGMTASSTARRVAMHGLMVKLAAELSPEDRKALAERRGWKRDQ